MPQNSVASAPDLAYAGQLLPGAPKFARSARTEGTGLYHGSPCIRGTDPQKQVKAFGALSTVDAQTFAGVVVGSFSRPYEDFATGLIADVSVSVLRLGTIAMAFAAAVTAGQNVKIDLATGLLYGFDEGAALSAGEHRLPGLRVMTTTTAAGLAYVEVALSTGAEVNGSITGNLTATGDLDAAGGFRQSVGAFIAPGAAGVIAASQTNLDLRHAGSVTAYASGWVAPRAGSIVGLSASLSAAITGAASVLAVKVTKNGTEVGAALDLSFTQAGAETKDYATQAKDVTTFAAGDVIGVSYTSDASLSNTPALVADIEIEC